MECSTTRNRYSVHWSRAIKIPPINPYMRTWRFISCRRIRYRNYRTHIGVGPTACMARSTLDRPCPSHGQTFNNPECLWWPAGRSVPERTQLHDEMGQTTTLEGAACGELLFQNDLFLEHQ